MRKPHLQLSESDQIYLEGLLSKGSLPARVYKRASALLELHRGKSLKEVASTFGVAYQTVSNWRDRYHSRGLSSLKDAPRPGRPLVIDGDLRAKITALACSEAPEGYARWSLRLLADKAVELDYCAHLSYSEVRLILKKTNLSLT